MAKQELNVVVVS